MPKKPTFPENLTHHFLIAPPDMEDGRFSESVVYIARHDKQGAFGFIVNQSIDLSLLDICYEMNISPNPELKQLQNNTFAMNGGPVMPEVGFILHTGLPTWASSVAVTENVCFTSSKDIIEAIAQENSVSHYMMCLGHAGWLPNQLEDELDAGGWFVAPATSELLFDTPIEERWHSIGLKAGINFNWLVDTVGSA